MPEDCQSPPIERRLSLVEGCHLDNKGLDRYQATNKVAYASEQEAAEATSPPASRS